MISVRSFFMFIVLLNCLPLALGQVESSISDEFDQILVNSQDWQDVYSALLYGALVGKPVEFIFAPELAAKTVSSLPKDQGRVLLLESATKKQYVGVAKILSNEGFETVDALGSDSINLELAKTLAADTFIVTDPRYPYNVVTLSPYARLKDAYVLFGSSSVADDIASLVSDKSASVVIFGIVDNQVKSSLSSFNPQIIDEGGKFDNNVHIAKEILSETEFDQVTLTNGEFIEHGLVQEEFPIVFLGRSSIPDAVEDFFVESEVKNAVVVGNYLASTAQTLRSRLSAAHGHDVFMLVRFAKSPVGSSGAFSQAEALSFFALPIITPEIHITGMTYNRLTKQLEVTYDNPSEITTFFLGSFTITVDGESISVGDEDSQVIVSGQSKTILYDVGIDAEALSASSLVLFGDYPSSLEFELKKDFENVPIISVADDSLFEIREIVYDRSNKAFYITIFNPGEVDVFANLELVDVIVDGISQTIGTSKSFSVSAGEEKEVYIRAALSDLDIIENELVLVRGYYGQRENILFKTTEEELELQTRLIDATKIGIGVAIVVIVVLLYFLLFRRKGTYECNNCGHVVRSSKKPSRHNCGGRYMKRKK